MSFKSKVQTLAESAKVVTILLIVPMTTGAMYTLGILLGGVVAMGALTGLVVTLSIIFALLNLGMKNVVKLRDFVSGYAGGNLCVAGILDILQTVFFTYVGFHIGGVTLACALLFLGMGLSSLFAGLRLWKCMISPASMLAFREEMTTSI